MSLTKICPKCGKTMILRNGQYGKFYGCTAFKSNGCKGIIKYNPNDDKPAAPPPPPPSSDNRIYSKYQIDIFDFVSQISESLLVEATAGSGKTTTIIKAAQLLKPGLQVIFLAFGKDVTAELGNRLPAGVESRTTHSLALDNIRRTMKVKVNPNKLSDIFSFYFKENSEQNQAILKTEKTNILKCYNLLKVNLLDSSLESIQYISEKYNILFNSNTQIIVNAISEIWRRMDADKYNLDFDDMLVITAKNPNICRKFDVVMLDEAQDMNLAQITMLQNSLKPGGRLIAVGDTAQSIFGFRGALTDSMKQIKNRFNCKVLPLSISYRLPSSHVELVKQILPDSKIEVNPNAIKGEIFTGKIAKYLQDFKDGGLALCRNNAPLVKPAFQLLSEGRKVIIKGKDIGIELISLIEKISQKFHAKTLGELIESVEIYLKEEGEKLIKVNQLRKLEALTDKLECIINFTTADSVNTIQDMIQLIDNIFSDDSTTGIVFSSVHKAKGLESDNVYIINPGLMPSKKAVTEEEKNQENNIIFVAYTRSKQNLYLLEVEK